MFENTVEMGDIRETGHKCFSKTREKWAKGKRRACWIKEKRGISGGKEFSAIRGVLIQDVSHA